MNNKTYDVLKFVAQILLPALGTLYFTVANIAHLPSPEEVVAIIVAFDTFLGVVLGLSTRVYNESGAKYDGEINVEEGEDAKLFSMSLNTHPEELQHKQEVLFKVNPPE